MTWHDPESYRPSHPKSQAQTLFDIVDKVVPDICVNKHQGNAESEAANRKIDPAKVRDRQRIFGLALERGELGITLKEAESRLGMLRNSVSGRLSELKALGMLVPTGEVRDGCAVLKPAYAESK
jgi:hypothetical protein